MTDKTRTLAGFCKTRAPKTKIAPISTQENFPRKEKFVKCDWPTQIFLRKKILKLKMFLTGNGHFGLYHYTQKVNIAQRLN
jgi:hypothetical protein